MINCIIRFHTLKGDDCQTETQFGSKSYNIFANLKIMQTNNFIILSGVFNFCLFFFSHNSGRMQTNDLGSIILMGNVSPKKIIHLPPVRHDAALFTKFRLKAH